MGALLLGLVRVVGFGFGFGLARAATVGLGRGDGVEARPTGGRGRGRVACAAGGLGVTLEAITGGGTSGVVFAMAAGLLVLLRHQRPLLLSSAQRST